MIAEKLRKSILISALQGKLTNQLPSDDKVIDFIDAKHIEKNISGSVALKIPKTWAWVRFSNLVDFKIGKTPDRSDAKYWGKGLPWISIADMNNQPELTKTKEEITEIAFNEIFKSDIVPRGTLIMSFKLTIGRVSILEIDALHNEAIISIYPKSNSEIIKRYLFYTLPFISNYADTKKAIKGKTLNKSSLSNLLIPVPPIEEQKRIVQKLDLIMPIIDELEKNENELETINSEFYKNIKNSVFNYAFNGNLPNLYDGLGKKLSVDDKTISIIPGHWDIKKMCEISNIMTGNSIPTIVKSKKYSKVMSGYPYIATKDINFNGIIEYNNGVRIPIDENFKIAKALNTLLCIEGGSAGRKMGLLDKDVAFGNKLCSFEPIGINYKYLYYFLKSSIFKTQFNNAMTGIIGGVGVNKIKNFLVPIPPLEEQIIIVEKLDNFMDILNYNKVSEIKEFED
mgnify:CR=1 FL=1